MYGTRCINGKKKLYVMRYINMERAA